MGPLNVDKSDVEAGKTAAWYMLHTAFSDTAVKAQPARIDAISALGTLSGFEQARALLRHAAQDPDRYLRLGAVAAMGASKSRVFLPDLTKALGDVAPEVSFAAAVGLWKMDDRRGKTLLYGVLQGTRKTKQGAFGSELHEADADLHNPTKLAELGGEQIAFSLFGPIGYAVSAYKIMHNAGNPNSARVLTATLLAQDKSRETMQQFIEALNDKDYAVRVAAARVLGEYRGREVTDPLEDAFADPKPAVRLMAAASFIRASQGMFDKEKGRHATRDR